MTTKQKVAQLRKLVNEYLNYIDKWTGVQVYYDKWTGDIKITWYRTIKPMNGAGEKEEYPQFTQREFTVNDLDDRILSYRNKINYAKNKKK